MVNQNNLQESAVVGVMATGTVLISLIMLGHIRKNLQNPSYIDAQKFLVPIFFSPVFIGWIAWIELLGNSNSHALNFLICVFESICIVFFLKYIEKMLGRVTENGKSVFSQEKMYETLTKNKPTKMCFCVKIPKHQSISDAKNYLTRVRIRVWQNAIVYISLAIAGIIIVGAMDDYNFTNSTDNTIFIIFQAIEGVSSTVALISLTRLGLIINTIDEMKDIRYLLKFNVVQSSLFFTQFQPNVIEIFSNTGAIANTNLYSKGDILAYTQDLLLCVEMIISCLFLFIAFPITDYNPKISSSTEINSKDYTNNNITVSHGQ